MAKFGRLAGRLGFRGLAVRVTTWAVQHDPSNPELAIVTSRLCSVGDPDGTVHHPLVGLISGPTSFPDTAIGAVETCLRTHPDDPRLLTELGRLELVDGRPEAARRLLTRSLDIDPQAETSYLVARAAAREADQLGGFSDRTLELHDRYAAQALQLDPDHRHARYHRLRVAVRAGDWTAAADTLGASLGADSPDEFDRLLRTDDARTFDAVAEMLAGWCASAATVDIEPDVLVAAQWRLLAAGRHRAAIDAKCVRARGIVARRATGTVGDVVQAVQAHLFLGDIDSARAVLARGAAARWPVLDRWALDCLTRDVAMFAGELSEWQAPPASVRASDRAADDRFRELVAGRRVAVVGPAASEIDHREELDGFDTVIRPKPLFEPDDRTRPTVGYFANTTVRLLADELRSALDDDRLSLAVLRPSAWETASRAQRSSDRVRFTARESLAWFDSTPFAVTRIIHDLLDAPPADRPAEIKVFRADLFTGPTTYLPAYRHDRDHHYEAAGLRPNLDGYGHDLLTDFRWIKQLVSSGIVRASPELELVIALEADDYLDAVTANT